MLDHSLTQTHTDSSQHSIMSYRVRSYLPADPITCHIHPSSLRASLAHTWLTH